MPSVAHGSAPRLLQFILFATWGESTPLSAVLLRYFNGVEPAQRLDEGAPISEIEVFAKVKSETVVTGFLRGCFEEAGED